VEVDDGRHRNDSVDARTAEGLGKQGVEPYLAAGEGTRTRAPSPRGPCSRRNTDPRVQSFQGLPARGQKGTSRRRGGPRRACEGSSYSGGLGLDTSSTK